MKNSLIKKAFALFLALMMLLSTVPAGVLAAEEELPMIKPVTSVFADFRSVKSQIVTATFLDKIDTSGAVQVWDMSANEAGTVMAWIKENAAETAAAGKTRYDLYIGGNGGIRANPASNDFFYGFEVLKEINGLENFDTSNATTLTCFFQRCYSLKAVDLSSWDTSNVVNMSFLFDMAVASDSGVVPALEEVIFGNWDTRKVTTMQNMFYNCQNIKALDISSFDTNKVTNMERMFYLCMSMETISIGKGWNVSQVTKSDAMFNCCYAVVGGKDAYYNKFAINYSPNKEYAKLKSEGGFLTPRPVDGIDAGDDKVLETGDTYTINTAFTPESAYDKGLTYESDDESVVTVDENGVIKAVGEGEATVTVTSKSDPTKTSEIKVTVKEPVVSVENITVDKTEINLIKGEKDKITVTVTPDNATDKSVTYTTSDDKVVTVDKNGNIEAVGEGEATITVTTTDGGKTVTVPVKVEVKTFRVTYSFEGDVPANQKAPDETVYKEGAAVTVAAAPSEDGYVFEGWTTDDADISSGSFGIENDVHIIGKWSKLYKVEYKYTDGWAVPDGAPVLPDAVWYKAGELVDVMGIPYVYRHVFFGWTTDDVDAAGNMFIMPENDVLLEGYFKIPVESIEFTCDKDTIELDYGKTEKLLVYVNPEDATIKTVVFESDHPEFVEVDTNGYITAKSEGTATITVYSKDDPTKKDTITVTVKIPVEKVEIEEESIELNLGDKDKIEAVVTPDNATDKSVTYTSSDEKVVKVDENGNIEAVGKGTAVITATSRDNPSKSDSVTVTVKIPVTRVEIEEESIELNLGDKDKIEAVVTPDNASDKSVTYTSSDEKVVKVDENGNIKAVGEGTAVITVTSKDDSAKSDSVTVTVKIPVEDITADKTEITLNKGETDKVTASVTPDDATDKRIIYTSSDEAVVTVDENGNIKAVGEGTATITVSSEDDPAKSVTVTVTVKIPVTEIIVNKEIELYLDDEINLGAKVNDDATNKELYYETEDSLVVKLLAGGNIYAAGEGTAIITITSQDNPAITETVKVTVKKPVIPAEEITVNKNEFTLEVGGTDKIEASVKPDDATDKSVTYTSGDDTVVTVDENGNITAVGEGSAIITITSNDGKATAAVTVKVEAPEVPDEPDTPEEPEEPAYTFEVPSELTVFVGEIKSLGVVITPDDGTVKPVYKSGAESIATVYRDGTIKGVNPGTTTVTVDFGGGDIRTIAVTVIALPEAPRTHYICFGKTDGIGWYEVSVNGGDFFPQGPNSTLEVEEGSILVVRVQDMWIDDEFDFYVNGVKVPMDPANTITVVVDGYMLIGALSMDVEVPDVEESVSIFDRISEFFAKIINWFKNLFK